MWVSDTENKSFCQNRLYLPPDEVATLLCQKNTKYKLTHYDSIRNVFLCLFTFYIITLCLVVAATDTLFIMVMNSKK